MPNKKLMFKDKYLKLAEYIGKILIEEAYWSESGVCWPTNRKDRDTQVGSERLYMYDGDSGIILFLLELYKLTGEEKYIDLIKSAANRIANNIDTVGDPGFYTGMAGIAYVLFKVGETLNETIYTAKAIEILCIYRHPDLVLHNDDFLMGNAGILLSLTYLYSRSKDERLLEIVLTYIERILTNAHHNKDGIFWNRYKQQIRSLSGFSHGSSGIGFVLIEVGNYFDVDPLKEIGAAAFWYENASFNRNTCNWPDMRHGIFDFDKDYPRFKTAYLKQEFDIFNESGDTVAWCHGAPGICLARLRAYGITRDKIYKKDINNAIKKIKMYLKSDEANELNLSLCHGLGSLISVFIEKYNVDKKDSSLKFAQKIVSNYLHKNVGILDEMKDDLSLFNGLSGIGYLFLQLYSPYLVISPLAPRINDQKNNSKVSGYFSESFINDLFSRKLFPITTKIITENKQVTHLVHKTHYRYFYKSLLQSLEQTIKANSPFALLKESFKIESTIRKADSKVFNNCFFHIRQLHAEEQTLYFSQTDYSLLLHLRIRSDPYILIKKVSNEWCDFHRVNNNKGSIEINNYVLLNPLYDGVEISYIGNYTNKLLSILSSPMSVKEVINILKLETDLEEREEVEFQNLIICQISVLLQKRCLIIEN
ncbi:hypothetical protein DVR12_03645 [Chitinophaga silvatica]|uniref:Lanthionine synthetase C-like protein n=1 Tax=Chitinophaga silvatica TaxID=2282649 RepID=A0A3E1YHL8_9BACT|nr:lanthionine synthetase LanC family protein [Chitinophaga silvatica]RFS26889.1 hypothetical protein DVR12_03645 [Chitinophaga silvatica]